MLHVIQNTNSFPINIVIEDNGTQIDPKMTEKWPFKVNSLTLEDEIAKSFEQYLGYEDSELEKINKIIFDFISEHNHVKLKNGKKFEIDQKEILAARSANFQGMDENDILIENISKLNRWNNYVTAVMILRRLTGSCTRANDMYIDYVTPHSRPFPSHKTI